MKLLILLLFLLSAGHCQAAIHAKCAILLNLTSDRILFERNADKKIAPASLTKIMTMFVALDAVKAGRLSLKDKITIPEIASRTGGSAMGLKAGEKVPLVRLLAGMAVSSGNDAATAVAIRVGGNIQAFAKQMNRKARSLGMRNSQFRNPTGLPSPGHWTTATDLALLCRAYLRSHPKAARFHSMTFFMHKGVVARNTNTLLGRVEGVDGLKTGWTVASGYNLIVTARRGNIRLLAIVLGCPDKHSRDSSAKLMLEAGFKYPANPGAARKMIEAG